MDPVSAPRISLDCTVTAEEWFGAVDFVNRVNWLFETWDVERLLNAFTPDHVVRHIHGTINGREESIRFFKETYPYYIPGVSRHATNHIVDRSADGVVVRYQSLLVRHSKPEDALKVQDGTLADDDSGLPEIWYYANMADYLVRNENSWRIKERHILYSMANNRQSPKTQEAEYFRPFLPREVK
jgi:hypothetical protein